MIVVKSFFQENMMYQNLLCFFVRFYCITSQITLSFSFTSTITIWFWVITNFYLKKSFLSIQLLNQLSFYELFIFFFYYFFNPKLYLIYLLQFLSMKCSSSFFLHEVVLLHMYLHDTVFATF